MAWTTYTTLTSFTEIYGQYVGLLPLVLTLQD